MPGRHIVTIKFPNTRSRTYKMGPSPNLAPRRSFARHPDTYMPKPARVTRTFWPNSGQR